MIHPFIADQMRTLQRVHPGATILALPSGACVVEVPRVRLLSGWSARIVSKPATRYTVEVSAPAPNPKQCTMLLCLPPGYPGAQPRHFWTREAIRSEDGHRRPGNSSEQCPMPGYDGIVGTWFAYSLQTWNPNNDGILQFFHTMRLRLQCAFEGREAA